MRSLFTEIIQTPETGFKQKGWIVSVNCEPLLAVNGTTWDT